MTKSAPWKGCLGCLSMVMLAAVLLFCLLCEPQVLFGSQTRRMAHWDHKINLPGSAQILRRTSWGHSGDGGASTTLLVPTSDVQTILVQVKPSPLFGGKVLLEGTPTDGTTKVTQDGEDEQWIKVQPDKPGHSHLTIITNRTP